LTNPDPTPARTPISPDPAGYQGSPVGEVIEVRVPDLGRLFHQIDPSPFHDRDLEPAAEEFILNWASQVPRSAQHRLLVHLERPGADTDEAGVLRDANRRSFARRAAADRRKLRELFHRGRISLLIGLAFLGASVALASSLAGLLGGRVNEFVRQSLLIGGWVAMWRPLEVFLYDWWPILAHAKRYERLAAMPVEIQYAEQGRKA
jgi:hypothetical protein